MNSQVSGHDANMVAGLGSFSKKRVEILLRNSAKINYCYYKAPFVTIVVSCELYSYSSRACAGGNNQ
jgi:hypothetical protein